MQTEPRRAAATSRPRRIAALTPPPVVSRAVRSPERAEYASSSRGFVIHDNPELGKVIDGKYRLTGLIAKGGMSRVFRAEHLALGRTVALKVLTTGENAQDDNEFRGRFLREVAACARLRHPNTIQILDHGAVGSNLLYMAMELVDGRTLHQAIRQEGPMRGPRIVNIMRQLCLSLREAHDAGMVHRDLKPGNVMLVDPGDGSEFVKLLDFGLVKELHFDDGLTGMDGVVGSPTYMSPEQISGQPADMRSDIYSLGVMLYTALSGRAPFGGANAVATMCGHLNSPPPPLRADLPGLVDCPALAHVVGRCLEKAPDHRYPDVDVLLADLRNALDPGFSLEEVSPGPPDEKLYARWQVGLAAATLGAAAFAATFTTCVWVGLVAFG